ncbi:MAG: TIGR00730 family Rossman fold protein [Desulfuromonas sp.]|nr:MAG: TIGR00730 family Rossman fold protein [Desulfuromonas sp.]
MNIYFDRPNPELDELIQGLIDKVGVNHERMVREMILTALKAGQENDYLADLKLMRTTMKEMRYTNKVFAPYRQTRKVTIFGSARTEPEEPIYQKCVTFSRLLVERGYMAITGGGGGIMQAGNEGAGADNSFAVNIHLPFEQETNPVMSSSDKVITYRYFFNRKVAFLKEAHAVALFPGGFGTLDEAMETLTLVQTGKNPPIPLVLIDDDTGDYWEEWFEFVKKSLLKRGLISGEDFSLFSITRDPVEAVELIDSFYRVYHSSRYVRETLVIRLNQALSEEQVATLEDEFSEILKPGTHIRSCSALPQEADQPDLIQLPRLALEFNRRSFGLLKAFIRRINSFDAGIAASRDEG